MKKLIEKLRKLTEDNNLITRTIGEWLKDNNENLLDTIYLVDIVKNYGYNLYEESIVINVKRRPNLTITFEDVNMDEDEFNQIINMHIAQLAHTLYEQYPDFIILGRSDGYWGFNNVIKNVRFVDGIESKLLDYIKQNDKELYNQLQNAENDEEIYKILDASSVLLDYGKFFSENTELTPEIIDKLENLSATIDSVEEFLNKTETYTKE